MRSARPFLRNLRAPAAYRRMLRIERVRHTADLWRARCAELEVINAGLNETLRALAAKKGSQRL